MTTPTPESSSPTTPSRWRLTDSSTAARSSPPHDEAQGTVGAAKTPAPGRWVMARALAVPA
ncbi:hypothetical protein COCOR_04029 [Corallococcus coralloides DSM 2259]|uniref:Uncharacterized protein n=1 Tax=Corallococcus coralloides (strain ATCC 25202 / DSM 2259 / NBRC 100086 / M2) TaxID=1144275 RepID=H8MVP9_CORCM|nr:hypothetical protein [Corallococcus coralloides]AFE05580.1 hypothetical protein COCOR_04029 [Corallococcus coralloides DSM 2259]